jgi:vacuolar protein sorting-associated protein 13A/C
LYQNSKTIDTLSQVHKIIGSADFLGNPVGLFNNISSGVVDIFYEPYQGFVLNRPQDLGIGLARVIIMKFLKKH